MRRFPFSRIVDALNVSEDHTEKAWDFIIFRTAYGPGYNEKFAQALDAIDRWVQNLAYGGWEYEDGSDATVLERNRVGDITMANYHNLIFDDEQAFRDASEEDLCHHFNAWASELDDMGPWDRLVMAEEVGLINLNAERIEFILSYQPTDSDDDPVLIFSYPYRIVSDGRGVPLLEGHFASDELTMPIHGALGQLGAKYHQRFRHPFCGSSPATLHISVD